MKLNLEDYSIDTKTPKIKGGKWVDRDLSFIDFNRRVLYYAKRDNLPINERLNFLGISGSNLDEFISVRFSDAYKNDSKVYNRLLSKIKVFAKEQFVAFRELKDQIEKKGLKFTKVSELNKKERDHLYTEYMNNIFPILTPVRVNSFAGTNINPYIGSGELCIYAVNEINEERIINLVSIGRDIDSVYVINDKKLLFTEDIIMAFMQDTLFCNKPIIEKGVFRILKDASFILSHDTSKFIVDRMDETLRKRNMSSPIYIETGTNQNPDTINLIMRVFDIPESHRTESRFLYYQRFCKHLFSDEKSSYKPFDAVEFENKAGYFSMFEAIHDGDILLHHPYDSYDTVVRFVQHAASDDDVIAIKQTLYRVSSIDSPIVNALCDAAKNGKKVSVLIEIKARFDEENNIHLVNKLQDAGANVLLGTEYLKTHCKMCIVLRREKKGLHVYSHVATGNYNEKTAKIYTDLSYFTDKQKIGIDLLHIFNILSGNSSPDEKLQKIYYSPITLRKQLTSCIERETENAKKKKPAEIFIKCNSISDPLIVNKLYEAANAGVKIDIICRGACSLVPTNKNMKIKSIVGRFLEHSRIYYFKNGKSPEYYISSADLLTRNLDKRVETLISLKDSSVIKTLKWIIRVFKADTKNSFVLNSNGKWSHEKGDFDAHQWFIDHTDKQKVKKSWK